MTAPNTKQSNQSIGFFAMTIGWMMMNLLYTFYLVSKYGQAIDGDVIMLWSGPFVVIAWAIFIIYPLKKLDHNTWLFKPSIFPWVTTLYAGLVYTLLVGGLFQSAELVTMFLPLALIVGFFFGLTYATLIASVKLVSWLRQYPIANFLFFVSPVFILTFFLWLLPTLFPSAVYRYMPDDIQEEIFAKTIMKYKVGDSFQKLRDEVPGHFDDWGSNGYFHGPHLEYHLETSNDTITVLDIKVKEK